MSLVDEDAQPLVRQVHRLKELVAYFGQRVACRHNTFARTFAGLGSAIALDGEQRRDVRRQLQTLEHLTAHSLLNLLPLGMVDAALVGLASRLDLPALAQRLLGLRLQELADLIAQAKPRRTITDCP